MEEKCKLVRKVVVCFHLCIYAPLIGQVLLNLNVVVFLAETRRVWTHGPRGSRIRLCLLILGLNVVLFLGNWFLCLDRLPYLKVLQDVKVHHFLPLRKYEVMLFEVFTEQLSRSLAMLHNYLAIFVVLGSLVQIPPPSALLE